MRYPVRLKRDTNGTVLVTFPDFPEAATFGEDNQDALLRAVDALQTAVQGRMSDREEIPEPSPRFRYRVQLPTQAVVKILLYRAMREKGVSKSKLARSLHWHRPQVDRLLDLRHASRLDHIDAALQQLGARLEVTTHAL
ncbi:MAG: type II toxin-antitoxin system HicB family antitoxin [Kiloniellaceae bacterium]